MQDFDHEFTEVRDLLQKADLPYQWRTAHTYKSKGGTRTVVLDVEIGIRAEAHARPTGAHFEAADVYFEMTLAEGGEIKDILSCQAQIVIDGITADGEALRFALHFDRHDVGQESTELHAEYHWQVGGNKLDDVQIGGLLVLEGPRFPSHPLDPILLIDFVLSHFNGAKRKLLMSSPSFVRYRRILHSSQSRYVAPFFTEIATALSAENFVGTNYWPALCGSFD